jgi:hypothetical protein
MTDTINNRRIFLTSGVAFAAFGASAGAGFAGVGSEGERGSLQHLQWRDAARYSQTDFLKLSPKELTYLYNYRIDGFNDAMASNLVKMMLSDRASAQKLLQDMAELTENNARKSRLAAEMQSGKQQTKTYSRGVKAWLRYPREGTYSTPGALSVKLFK